MPALTITAVDFTTDQLTIAGHGLVTGDGPAATRNIGGALPAPLVGVTDYWIIRVDANIIKLATSSANALAGTAINLTTNGTGTSTLEIGIPYRRARTYAAGAQLRSADLNAMMDADTAMHALLTGQAQSVWTDNRKGHLHAAAFLQTPSGTMVLDSNGWTTGAGVLLAPIALGQKQFLSSVKFGFERGAGSILMLVWSINITSGVQASASSSVTTGAGYQTHTIAAAAILAGLGWNEVPPDIALMAQITFDTVNANNKFAGAIVNA